jgi:hypothetical protein
VKSRGWALCTLYKKKHKWRKGSGKRKGEERGERGERGGALTTTRQKNKEIHTPRRERNRKGRKDENKNKARILFP